jgi:hypothetical protein
MTADPASAVAASVKRRLQDMTTSTACHWLKVNCRVNQLLIYAILI